MGCHSNLRGWEGVKAQRTLHTPSRLSAGTTHPSHGGPYKTTPPSANSRGGTTAATRGVLATSHTMRSSTSSAHSIATACPLCAPPLLSRNESTIARGRSVRCHQRRRQQWRHQMPPAAAPRARRRRRARYLDAHAATSESATPLVWLGRKVARPPDYPRCHPASAAAVGAALSAVRPSRRGSPPLPRAPFASPRQAPCCRCCRSS